MISAGVLSGEVICLWWNTESEQGLDAAWIDIRLGDAAIQAINQLWRKPNEKNAFAGETRLSIINYSFLCNFSLGIVDTDIQEICQFILRYTLFARQSRKAICKSASEASDFIDHYHFTYLRIFTINCYYGSQFLSIHFSRWFILKLLTKRNYKHFGNIYNESTLNYMKIFALPYNLFMYWLSLLSLYPYCSVLIHLIQNRLMY